MTQALSSSLSALLPLDGGSSLVLAFFTAPLPILPDGGLGPLPKPVTVGLQLTNLLVLALHPVAQALPVCHQTVRMACSTWQVG